MIPLKRRAIVLIAISVGLYLLAVGCMAIAQEGFVFHPSTEVWAAPGEWGVSVEDVGVATRDGEKIHGWFVKGEEGAPVILWCHGNAGNITWRVPLLAQLAKLGVSVLIFDYRGYGRSTGTPTEEGTYRDVEAVWDHLVGARGFAPSSVIVLGRSLGGGVATHLAVTRNPGGLILASAFTSLPAVGREAFWYMPVGLVSRIEYPNLERMTRIDCPVLVLHGRDDEVVGYHHGRALFEAAREPKMFAELKGGHNDERDEPSGRFVGAVRRFLEEQL